MDEENAGTDGTEVLFRLLVDPTTREVLHAVDREAMSAKELADRCDVSGPTMYRKVNAMLEFDLLETGTRIDPNGNHYTVYRSNVDHVRVAMDPSANRTDVDVTYRRRADQFIHLWEGLTNE